MPRHFAEDEARVRLVDHYTPVVCERRSKCKIESSRKIANRESGKELQRIMEAQIGGIRLCFALLPKPVVSLRSPKFLFLRP
jgi:hypothetical protein